MSDSTFDHAASPTPHRQRRTWLLILIIIIALIALAAAIIIPIIRASQTRAAQHHEQAVSACEAAQREFSTLNTTYTTTLSSALKLAQGDGKTVSEDTAQQLEQKIQHIDSTGTVRNLTSSTCNTNASTSELEDLTQRYGIANSSMINRMRDVQTDVDHLRRNVTLAQNANRSSVLQSDLTFANTVYERSANRAPELLRATLQTQIEHAQALLEPTSGASNTAINESITALTQATDAVIANMPLDCELTPCVALTFDDGPNKQLTPQLLEALHQANVPATFFVQGQFVSGSNTQLLRTMSQQGNEIGSMSWRHKQLHTLSQTELNKWLHDTDEVIETAGVTKPTLFRPPDGAWSEDVIQTAAANGQSVILWNVDSRDWDPNISAADIANNVVSSASAGSIVALHDGNERTITAIPAIANGLRERGFTLVTVSQLLSDELNPGTVFYSRGDTAQDHANTLTQ